MNTTGQEQQSQTFQAEESSIVPAVVTCMTCVAGTLGAILIAAGPWLVLSYL